VDKEAVGRDFKLHKRNQVLKDEPLRVSADEDVCDPIHTLQDKVSTLSRHQYAINTDQMRNDCVLIP
jgi:hypothetical protein